MNPVPVPAGTAGRHSRRAGLGGVCQGRLWSVLSHPRTRKYITAVRSLAGGDWRIMLRHMLPNTMAPILVVAGFQLGHLILLEATLSF